MDTWKGWWAGCELLLCLGDTTDRSPHHHLITPCWLFTRSIRQRYIRKLILMFSSARLGFTPQLSPLLDLHLCLLHFQKTYCNHACGSQVASAVGCLVSQPNTQTNTFFCQSSQDLFPACDLMLHFEVLCAVLGSWVEPSLGVAAQI